MSAHLDPVTEHKVEWMIEGLCAEFHGRFARDEVRAVMHDSVDRLAATATVFAFLPVMAQRCAREQLQSRVRSSRRSMAIDPRPWAPHFDVVFVSLSGGGRGQIAAAFTSRMSEGRVTVHSAGTAVRATIDPLVRDVLQEAGLDPDEAFARPVTDDVLAAADVVVTMGQNPGVLEIPSGVRHEDWRIGDPIGAPIEEVRCVRADIEYRVGRLLDQLGARSGRATLAG